MTARLLWLTAAALLLAAPACRCNEDRTDQAPVSPGHPERTTPGHPERSAGGAESKGPLALDAGPPVFALHLTEQSTSRRVPDATRIELTLRDNELSYTKTQPGADPIELRATLSPGDLAAIERTVRAADLLDAEPLPAPRIPAGAAALWTAELSLTLDNRQHHLSAAGAISTDGGSRTTLADAPLYRSLRRLTVTLESLARKRAEPPVP